MENRLPWWLSGTEPAFQCWGHRFNPCIRKILWRKKCQLTPACLPGKSHWKRSLAGYSLWGFKRIGHHLVSKQQKLRKTIWWFPSQNEKELLCDLAVPLLRTYIKKMKTLIWNNICISTFTAALFTIAKIWKQRKCQPWKKNKILPAATTWMNVEGIRLSEISLKDKDKHHMRSHDLFYMQNIYIPHESFYVYIYLHGCHRQWVG